MNIKVAIFEDNDGLRESLSKLVDSADDLVCCGSFANGEKVLRDIATAEPDVVLMDIDMPGISGIQAVKVIKEKFPLIQILMQTVFEENDKIFASICAGASGYMLKKTSPAKMIEAIREVAEGGAPMSPSIAVKVLQMFQSQSRKPQPEFIDLTDREREVLTHLVNGDSYKMIASKCFISIDTVKSHIKKIYEKLHVNSKGEAVAKAIHQKLV